MFGFERLMETLIDLPSGNAAQMLNHLKDVVADFTENTPPQDDLTIVIIRAE